MEEVKTAQPNASDIEKIYGFLCYLFFFGILIYINKKDSEYVQFHAKQGIVLFILGLINFFLMVIPFLGWVLMPFLNLLVLVFFIIGTSNALAGKMNELPFVGKAAHIIK